mgnify:CR=1 FL=1
MLARKKISIKKLIIYASIIFFILGGAGFMLYQNKKLTTSESTDVNLPVPDGLSQSLDVNNNIRGAGFNLNIFSSAKFKNLLENSLIIKEPPEIGKRDPFKPN